MTVAFKPITPEEVELLRDVACASFIAAYNGQIPEVLMHEYLDSTHSTEVLSQELRMEDTFYFFVLYQGRAAGFLMLEHPRTHPGLDLATAVFIHRIYLLPEYWHRGLGAAMMAFCEAFAQDRRAGWLWLQVWRENQRALKFYQKWGFEQFSTIDFILGNVVHDDLLLRKPIFGASPAKLS